MLSEDKVKDRLSIPFFMGIFGELDHWYHRFVVIWYHNFGKMQYGKLYKTTENVLFAMLILLKMIKKLLTFQSGYDMLIMLGWL